MEITNTQTWIPGGFTEYMSQPYPREVTASRSGPDTRLTELEQQLEVAETRCGSLKSQLDYMKMIYQGVQTVPADCESKKEIESDKKSIVSESLQAKTSPLESKDLQETVSVVDENYYSLFEDIHKMQEIVKEDTSTGFTQRTPRYDSKYPLLSPKIEKSYSVVDETNEESNTEYQQLRRIKARNITHMLTERTSSPSPKFSCFVEGHETCKEHDVDDANAFQHPYQKHLIEYSKGLQRDIQNTKELIIRSSIEDQEERNDPITALKAESKKQELVLKITGSAENTHTIKRRKIIKSERKHKALSSYSATINKKIANSKIDDTMSVTSKIKRKKGRIKSTNSKSTILTKDTNITVKKDFKKRKQRGHTITIPSTEMPKESRVFPNQLPKSRNDVVEIYHNDAAESGTISLASSKHSRADQQLKHCQSINNAFKIDEKSIPDVSYTHQNERELLQQTEKPESNSKHIQDTQYQSSYNHNTQQVNCHEDYKPKQSNIQNEAMECYKSHHHHRYRSFVDPSYYDPTVIRNYEMPTVASKLKQVSRSYFNRFNFKNIPFVVGTSVTPSHNLGLNIQQVLSIMKTRPMANGITPLLIRKVSKGMKPVSSLFDQINDQYRKSPRDTTVNCNGCLSEKYNNTDKEIMESSKVVNCFQRQTPRIITIPNLQDYCENQRNDMAANCKRSEGTLYEDEKQKGYGLVTKPSVKYDKTIKASRKSITGNPNLTSSTLLKQRQEELNMNNGSCNVHTVPDNTKGIREVLIKLHDQFEEMNTNYEKLQEQVEKTNDKSLTKQIVAIEEELSAKEEEINAVVGLYKEVLALKQQMKLLHERNSFVCVATEAPHNAPAVHLPVHARPQTANPVGFYSMRRGSVIPSITREPSTAIRLAGLLRQIQIFQKQLKLTS
ncbi:uncharacterized protein LOC107271884 [Cephus cinctus]|uniref:Uncharacterized protein LOC107271884 n=1 Tax=Cephus cinctus TaxID=211228 RepID=A0AAJ7C7N3_CEPCN|nr:uncharacterized protein LOC107271884 [Cephus cinctus]